MRKAVMGIGLICLGIVLTSVVASAGDRAKKKRVFLDTMTAKDFKACGLRKLGESELDTLNAWMLQTYVDLLKAGGTDKAEHGEIPLYANGGEAIAYIADDAEKTIYLWDGKPAAYLHEGKMLYGFNGKHLAWYEDGVVYDRSGKRLGSIGAKTLVRLPARFTGFKQPKPFHRIRKLAPLKPSLFKLVRSDQKLVAVLLEGGG